MMAGLKAAGATSAVNLALLGLLALLGYDEYPSDPSGIAMTMPSFAFAMIIIGGLVPGLLGSIVWLKMHENLGDKAWMGFSALALVIATLMTLPLTNPNAPSGDALVLVSILHYSTALLGGWLIPHFSSTGCTCLYCPICNKARAAPGDD